MILKTGRTVTGHKLNYAMERPWGTHINLKDVCQAVRRCHTAPGTEWKLGSKKNHER